MSIFLEIKKRSFLNDLFPGDIVKVAVTDAYEYSFKNGWDNFYEMKYLYQNDHSVFCEDSKNKLRQIHHSRVIEIIKHAKNKQLKLF